MNQSRKGINTFIKTKTQAGFTLLEVMVVVVIIAIMAAAIGPKLLGNIEKASISRAKTDIKSIVSMLQLYKAENYAYPSTEQGLEALVRKPDGDPVPKNWRQLNDKTPLDPWENPYKYLKSSQNEINVFSYGPDGVQSEDDISSQEAKN